MSFKVPREARVRQGEAATSELDGNNGAFIFRLRGVTKMHLCAIASDGMGWEHVSVSVFGEKRCPTWEEMCAIKKMFWDDEDTVIQYHPKASEYVNNHPGVLHLWRRAGQNEELPPSILVGIKL